MIQQEDEGGRKLGLKLCILLLMLQLIILVPYDQITNRSASSSHYRNFINAISNGPTTQRKQIEIQQFLSFLAEAPFTGSWQKSIKKSVFLTKENGKIDLCTTTNKTQGVERIMLKLIVYDGEYLDDGFFQITIDSAHLIARNKFVKNAILYETISPIVGLSKQGKLFSMKKEESLYIDKLKIKVEYSESLSIQILLSSDHNLNIISTTLRQTLNIVNHLLFAMIITIESIAQIIGIYYILSSVHNHTEAGLKYSYLGLILATSWDIITGAIICFLSFNSELKLAIYVMPLSLVIIKTLYLQISVLWWIRQSLSAEEPHSEIAIYCETYATLIMTCLIVYFSKLNTLGLMASCILIMVPQIISNYRLGNRMKTDLTFYLFFALPRYSLIMYLRLYDGNIFSLKPQYQLVILCLLMIAAQIIVLKIQQKHGVRSIIPRFISFPQFKYFMSNPEEDICAICQFSLKDLPNNLSSIIPEDGFVVCTPCKHKFHSQCLETWIDTKLQCPICRSILPPMQK